MKNSVLSVFTIFFILFSGTAFSQETESAHVHHGARSTPLQKPDDSMQDMPGMQHDTNHTHPLTFINKVLLHDTAGTSAQPNSTD